ncbi:uncharacterized protein ARMOST_14941 [Armillaria ostoyae]|uniref:Uncharacterized protein n=1 Tax=Armillaria ostoyae TaxID=47428 RepID=A0A284RRZ5_ARMOS|nr:uncharacterized protein ARMOST_14941 [Armillaria ostoyae]
MHKLRVQWPPYFDTQRQEGADFLATRIFGDSVSAVVSTPMEATGGSSGIPVHSQAVAPPFASLHALLSAKSDYRVAYEGRSRMNFWLSSIKIRSFELARIRI